MKGKNFNSSKTNYGGNASFIIPASALPKHSHQNDIAFKDALSTNTIVDKKTEHTHSVSASGLAALSSHDGNGTGRRFRYAREASSSNITIKPAIMYITINNSDFKGRLNFKSKDIIYFENSEGVIEEVKIQEKYYPAYYSVIKIMKYKSN